jgi:hypothetical protein
MPSLEKYLVDENRAEKLGRALKIAINIVYGLTKATFDSIFRDKRNRDNIVAKRGALFMIDLKLAVTELGYKVVHIKTDSIKIADATKDVIDFVKAFGRKYGYEFNHEDTFDKFCLFNDAVYVGITKEGKWKAVGVPAIHPYVFKTLFSKEALEFKDLCETKSVSTAMYLQMGEHKRFIGKIGSFVPILPGKGGGLLLREKEDKFYAVTGTKGYEWMESNEVKELGKENDIDYSYYEEIAKGVKDSINKFCDVEWFLNDSWLYDRFDNRICPF